MRAIRHALALLLAAAALAGLSLRADTKGKAPADGAAAVADGATRQAALKRSFELFRNRLLTLAARLEASEHKADRDTAANIRKALKAAGELSTEAKFEALVRGLNAPGADRSLDALRALIKDNKDLRADLKKLIDILQENDQGKRLAEKIKKAEEVLKQLKELRDRQARLQARTEMGKADTKKLGADQGKLTRDTKEVAESKTDDDGKPRGFDQIEDQETRDKARKLVEQAVGNQKMAEAKLGKGNPSGAGDSQGAAVRNLDDAIKVIEEEIRQRRKEEREQKLRDLLARARRMLTLQVEVQTGVVSLDGDIRKATAKPNALIHAARGNKLSDKERAVVKEADDALKLIKSEPESAAGAFAEAFEQISSDTATVMDRLGQTDTGAVTQKIIDDVVETLKDVIKALEKELKDNDNDTPPRPPGDGGPGRKRPLVDLIQELKLIYAMQKRVADRTALYGKTYAGEQAPRVAAGMSAEARKHAERVLGEIRALAERQDRITRVTREISKKPEAQRLGM